MVLPEATYWVCGDIRWGDKSRSVMLFKTAAIDQHYQPAESKAAVAD